MPRIQEQANEAVNQSADTIRDKAAEMTQNVREAGQKVRDAAVETYGDVRDQARNYIDSSKQAAEDWERSLESYVQEKPLQAVLIAAGVGLLLGLIWKRS